jgi:hypothetical protein
MTAPRPRSGQPRQLDAGRFEAEIGSFRLHLAAERKAVPRTSHLLDPRRFLRPLLDRRARPASHPVGRRAPPHRTHTRCPMAADSAGVQRRPGPRHPAALRLVSRHQLRRERRRGRARRRRATVRRPTLNGLAWAGRGWAGCSAEMAGGDHRCRFRGWRRAGSLFGLLDVSAANEFPGSQVGSQRRQAPGNVRPNRARITPGERLACRRRAAPGDSPALYANEAFTVG